jgi:protease IV
VATERAGMAPSVEPDVRAYPRMPTVARLRRARSSDDPAAARGQVRFEAWGTLAGLAARLGLPA